MANPFYGSRWNPNRHGYYHQAPIQPQYTKPKVISIPVHFAGSDNATSKLSPTPATAGASAVLTGEVKIAAAVTIQRVVRGFLVRKNARVVRQVAEEVEEIEQKVREQEGMIWLDARERLLVSEKLMALLLRLDSVRGVRDFRKRVIRRVISLQEAIDSMPPAVDGPISTIGMAEGPEDSRDEASEKSSIDYDNSTDQTLDLDEDMKEEKDLGMKMPIAVESMKRNNDPMIVDGTISTSGAAEEPEVSIIKVSEEVLDHEYQADRTPDFEVETGEAVAELEIEIPVEMEPSDRQIGVIEAANDTISTRNLVDEDQKSSVELVEESDHKKTAYQIVDLNLETKKDEEADLEVDIPAVIESPKRKCDQIEVVEEESRSGSEEEIPADENRESLMVESREEGMGMREIVERMAMENEKLKGMVAQLCATSSEQCRLMEGLVGRVEHLERVVHHCMDRRKKRSIAPCSVLSSAK